MYKNLSGDGLGVSCRQNELIELALTYGFMGVEVDIAEMSSRADRFSPEFARRFIDSAQKAWQLKVGSFKLPFKITVNDADYGKVIERVNKYAELAGQIGATCCYLDIEPSSNEQAYHDNFELHRKRISEIADIFGAQGTRVGLGLLAAESARVGREYEFIFQVEPLLTLIRTIGNPNVGLNLDSWNWVVGGGAMDQIGELKVEEIVCVRLADFPEGVTPDTAKDSDRIFPGENEATIAPAIISHLAKIGYDGPVAVHPHSSQFSGVTRDNIVQQASQALGRVFETAGVEVQVASAVQNNNNSQTRETAEAAAG